MSRRFGYEPDGVERHLVWPSNAEGASPAPHGNDTRTIPVTVEGLAPCPPLFGLDTG
ncbi:hypothetical protein [Thermomonospora umbrina]|uniref:hypothetical protein n=1 Tax=Thermomonospora umbrina TaxID=111806 RepID=UPI001FE28223|nr:hypothetical protein [Thermomonospora umbrina]